MTIITPGDDGTLVVDDDGNGFVIIDGIAYPVTVDPDDDEGGAGGGGAGGGTEEEEPLAFGESDFICVTLHGDTLFNGHSLFYAEEDTNIQLEFSSIFSLMVNALWGEFNSNNSYIPMWDELKDKTDKTKVRWTFNNQQHQGEEYSMPLNEFGSHQLIVDATDALFYKFEYIDTDNPDNLVDTILKFSDYVQDKGQMTVNVHISQSGILHFRPISENHYLSYGFDDALCHINQQNGDYEVTEIGGTQYHVPWMGALPSQEVQLRLQYISANPQLDSLIVLERSNNAVTIDNFINTGETTFSSKTITISLIEPDSYYINAYSIDKNNQKTLIGKLNIESRNLNTVSNKTIRIIRVKRSDEDDFFPFEPSQKQQLINQINQYYKQAFLEFTHDSAIYSDTLTINKSTQDEMVTVLDMHNLQPDNNAENTYYVYICSKGANTSLGLARYDRLASAVFLVANEQLKPVIASHELGHNLGLAHPFEWTSGHDWHVDNYSILSRKGKLLHQKQSTKNIMDYHFITDNRKYFWWFQINHLKAR